MKLEQYDVEIIRNEYVGTVAKKMQGRITQDDFNKMLTLLDDFVAALAINKIMLVKAIEEIDDEQIANENSNEQTTFEPDITEEPTQEFDEFEEPIEPPNDLSEVYKKKIAELEAREKALYELENAKPEKFTDRVRQFEKSDSAKKKLTDEDEDD